MIKKTDQAGNIMYIVPSHVCTIERKGSTEKDDFIINVKNYKGVPLIFIRLDSKTYKKEELCTKIINSINEYLMKIPSEETRTILDIDEIIKNH